MRTVVKRRELLCGGASLVALGGSAVYTRAMRARSVVRNTGPEIGAFKPDRDLAGLSHPMTEYAKICNVRLSRLILGGADFICCGMYDYQLVEDVNIANEVFVKGLPKRPRPWHGCEAS